MYLDSISIVIGMAGIHSHTNGWFTLTRKFMSNETSPTNHSAWTDRPMNALQLYRRRFSHKETL